MNFTHKQLAEVHDTAIIARNNLVDNGWGQEFSRNPATGQLCLMGAMSLNNRSGYWGILKTYIEDKKLKPHWWNRKRKSVVDWNDQRKRTRDEVFALLDDVIAETKPYADEFKVSQLVEIAEVHDHEEQRVGDLTTV